MCLSWFLFWFFLSPLVRREAVQHVKRQLGQKENK